MANLSKLPGDVVTMLKAILKGGALIGTGSDELQIERSLPHGHVAATLGTVRRIALDRLILSSSKDAASRRHCDLVLAMIVDRMIAPRSKLGFVRAVDEETAVTSLGAVLGLGKVRDCEAYEALDWLLERQARIESGLARRHLADGVLVLYDVSSSYFEGRHCPLAQFGHSRDHRGDRPQIIYGLLCTREGLPIAIEVFEGNTADPTTLRRVHAEVPQEAAVRKIKRHLGQVFHDLARRTECRIEEGQLMPDHVHMLISIPPKDSVAQIIGYMKGKSSIWIAQNVKRKMRNFLGHKFLARGYFVTTVGRDEEMIRAYIKN